MPPSPASSSFSLTDIPQEEQRQISLMSSLFLLVCSYASLPYMPDLVAICYHVLKLAQLKTGSVVVVEDQVPQAQQNDSINERNNDQGQ